MGAKSYMSFFFLQGNAAVFFACWSLPSLAKAYAHDLLWQFAEHSLRETMSYQSCGALSGAMVSFCARTNARVADCRRMMLPKLRIAGLFCCYHGIQCTLMSASDLKETHLAAVFTGLSSLSMCETTSSHARPTYADEPRLSPSAWMAMRFS